jgi:hypothetical protein
MLSNNATHHNGSYLNGKKISIVKIDGKYKLEFPNDKSGPSSLKYYDVGDSFYF